MSDIDEEIRREVIPEVYRRVDDLDWDGMTQRERSKWYDRWVDDPEIGGKLTRFISRERARVWLKDGPVKELPRARNGIGPYAGYVVSRYPGADHIARQVLGAEWNANLGTVGIKPNRCLVRGPGPDVLMIWGPSTTLRELVWAGMNALVDGGARPFVVVTSPQGVRLTEGEKARHQKLAQIAGVELAHITLRLVRA